MLIYYTSLLLSSYCQPPRRNLKNSYKIQKGDYICLNLRRLINQFMKVGGIKTKKELTIGVQQLVRLLFNNYFINPTVLQPYCQDNQSYSSSTTATQKGMFFWTACDRKSQFFYTGEDLSSKRMPILQVKEPTNRLKLEVIIPIISSQEEK